MDLSTHYLGLKLDHPLVPSASPLSMKLADIRRLEDAGAAAIVMYSLFEEQIIAEAPSYFPEAASDNVGPEQYLELLRSAKEAVDVPVIGSLNGVSPGGWTTYASLIEEAGADALELNIYYLPTDPFVTSADIEQRYVATVAAVKRKLSIPVAVKLSPYFSSVGHMAVSLQRSGADALVMFNRFYQPDFNLEELAVVPNLTLSTSNELRLPLRWIALLYGRVDLDFALTSGVHNHLDALKGLLAGANVVMMASELLKNGPERLSAIRQDMERWLGAHGYESVEQLRGSLSLINVKDTASFERANYMKVLQSWQQDSSGVLL